MCLHDSNKRSEVPIAHSTKLNEDCHTIFILLQKLKYNDHEWVMYVDFKMVNFLLRQQIGCMKFLCLWNSRAKSDH